MTAAHTPEEIVARAREVASDDMLGWRVDVLVRALGYEDAREILGPDVTADLWEDMREGDTLEAARAYYGFAIGKIRDHRGISAERSTIKLREYAWLLGRDDAIAAMDAADYSQYGAPKVKAFGEGLGLAWPDEPAMKRMADGEPCEPGCVEGCGS